MSEAGDWSGSWAIPRPVLRLAVVVALALLAPLVAAFATAGATAALSMSLGYTVTVSGAMYLPMRYASCLAVPGALAAVVAASVSGQAVPAACFAALACLLVAPADQVGKGLLAGIPTVCAVLVGLPVQAEPAKIGIWTLVGGVVAVVVLGRLPRTSRAEAVPARIAWRHAVVMALAVGLVTGLVTVLEVPHGYWLGMTLTVILRPFGAETQAKVRERVSGTVGGALLALALAFLLPGWAVLAAVALLMVPMVAYTALGRYALFVVCITPIVVLLGSGGSEGAAAQAALDRVALTLVAALIATALAVALARADRVDSADPTGVSPVYDPQP